MKEKFPTEIEVDNWLKSEVYPQIYPLAPEQTFEFRLAYAYKEARRILSSVNSALLDLEDKEKSWRGR